MKQSCITGKQIYDEMKRLHTELRELGEACDVVADDIGRDHIAYSILDKQYKIKEEELRELEKIRYVPYASAPMANNPFGL